MMPFAVKARDPFTRIVAGLVAALSLFAASCASAPRADPAFTPEAAAPSPESVRPPTWKPPHTSFFAGGPRATSPVTILVNSGSITGYSDEMKSPLWVCYRLFKVGEDAPGLGRIERFSIDDRTASKVTHDDYTGTGFDRGHMAPSAGIAKRYGEAGWRQTYLMSNIAPQTPGLNQRPWEAFEARESDVYAEELGEIWITTGPIYEGPCEELTASRGRTDIRVPSSFYKILATVKDGRVELLALEMKQTDRDAAPIRRFVTTVDDLERRTGIDFFADLPDPVEIAVEAASPAAFWDVEFVLRPTFPGNTRPLNTHPCD